jgi:hypothetical protein
MGCLLQRTSKNLSFLSTSSTERHIHRVQSAAGRSRAVHVLGRQESGLDRDRQPARRGRPAKFRSNTHLLPDAFTLGWFDKNTDAPASDVEIEQEYQTVKFSGTALKTTGQKEAITRLRITDEVIDGFVMSKLGSFETTLLGRQPFAGLDEWPADGQLGPFSMAWAMGPMFRFPKFGAAAGAGDWLTFIANSSAYATVAVKQN